MHFTAIRHASIFCLLLSDIGALISFEAPMWIGTVPAYDKRCQQEPFQGQDACPNFNGTNPCHLFKRDDSKSNVKLFLHWPYGGVNVYSKPDCFDEDRIMTFYNYLHLQEPNSTWTSNDLAQPSGACFPNPGNDERWNKKWLSIMPMEALELALYGGNHSRDTRRNRTRSNRVH